MGDLWFKSTLAELVMASKFLLGACSLGPGAAPTDKEPDPKPLPTLRGSWQLSATDTRILSPDRNPHVGRQHHHEDRLRVGGGCAGADDRSIPIMNCDSKLFALCSKAYFS